MSLLAHEESVIQLQLFASDLQSTAKPATDVHELACVRPIHRMAETAVADDLRKRFGLLVAAHRRRLGLTQEALAAAAGVSVDTISKIEIGATGARFPMIEKIATALRVDPAELFTTEATHGAARGGRLNAITSRLAGLSDPQLAWLQGVIEAALIGRERG